MNKSHSLGLIIIALQSAPWYLYKGRFRACPGSGAGITGQRFTSRGDWTERGKQKRGESGREITGDAHRRCPRRVANPEQDATLSYSDQAQVIISTTAAERKHTQMR